MCNYVVSIKVTILDKINQYQAELPTSFFFSWTSQLQPELGLGLDCKWVKYFNLTYWKYCKCRFSEFITSQKRRSQTWSVQEERTATIDNNNNNYHQSSIQWNMGSIIATRYPNRPRCQIGTNQHVGVPSGRGDSACQFNQKNKILSFKGTFLDAWPPEISQIADILVHFSN